MIQLFQLLFSRAYWRRLSLKAFWQQAWLCLRRAHKDRRARKFLGALLFLLLVPFACLIYLVWLIRSGAVFLIVFALPAVWWIRRSQKRDEPAHITPQPEPAPVIDTEGDPRICTYLGEMAVLYAVMLDRAGSEQFLRNKELPPNVEVVSRRTHIDLLRRTGIWEKIASIDRESLMLPDRHWDEDQIQRVVPATEPLRLLRWILRVDFFLPVIGRQNSVDYKSAHEIVANPADLLGAKKLVGRHDLNTARQAAEHYFLRCVAESISRGYHQANNEVARTWAQQAAGSLAGKQNEDLLIGNKLVSEVGAQELLWTLHQARRRFHFLSWIKSLMDGSASLTLPFSFPAEPTLLPTQIAAETVESSNS